ncbi:MAG: hypothetical protein ACXABY_20190, partial [Candidatus Thorarchaeota archaeon]
LPPEEDKPESSWYARRIEVGNCVEKLSHESVTIDVHLGAKDSVSICKPLIKSIAQSAGLFKRVSFDDSETVTWHYTHEETNTRFMVRCWIYHSEVCKLVPTGETRPVMKVVCEGEEVADE